MLGLLRSSYSSRAWRLFPVVAEKTIVIPPRAFFSTDAKPTKTTRLPRWDEWSDADTDLLCRSHAEGKTLAECCELFPTRSRAGVHNKLNRLGLRYRKSPKQGEDCRRVCELALDGLSVGQIRAQLPHLKFSSIYNFAYLRGITLKPMPNKHAANWTAEEDGIVMDGMAKKQAIDSIAQRLSGRSAFSIETRIKNLRLYGSTKDVTPRGQWTKEEEDLLNELYNKKIPYRDIAQRLGRSYLSVLRRISISRHGSTDSSAETHKA